MKTLSPVTSLSAFLPSDVAWSCFSGRTRTASKPGDKSNKVNPAPDQSDVSQLTVYEPKPCDPVARVNSCVERSGKCLIYKWRETSRHSGSTKATRSIPHLLEKHLINDCS